MVDHSLEDCARQRVLTATAPRALEFPRYLSESPMTSNPARSNSQAPSKARAIVQRTRGRTHGPITRLMSPSDFGEILDRKSVV